MPIRAANLTDTDLIAEMRKVDAAKDFLVGKLIDQARRKDAPLSPTEQRALAYPTFNPGHPREPDPEQEQFIQQFIAHHDEKQFTKKLAGLARRAFDYDLLNAPGEVEKWRHSYNFVWDHGEYWVLQAIDAAGLRRQMRKGLLARIFGCR